MNIDFLKTKSEKVSQNRDKNREEVLWSKPTDDENKKIEKKWWINTLNFFGFLRHKKQVGRDLNQLRKEMLRQIKFEPKSEISEIKGLKDIQTSVLINKNLKKEDINDKKMDEKEENFHHEALKKNSGFNFDFFKKIKTALKKHKKIKKDFYKIKKEETREAPKIEAEKNIEKQSEAGNWDGPGVLSTNLIKENYFTYFDWERNIIFLVIGVLFSSIILSGLYFTIIYYEQVKKAESRSYQEKLNDLQSKINEAKKSLSKSGELSNKVRLVRVVLDNHVYWSNFFIFLEKNTLPDVYFAGFSGETSGEYALEAKARDFLTMQAQIKQFKGKEEVQSVQAESGVKEKIEKNGLGSVGFKLDLKVNPAIFFEK